MSINYFEQLIKYNERTLEDKQCIRYILDILERELHINFETLIKEKSELEGQKACEVCKKEAYEAKDNIGFGYQAKNFSYKEKMVEDISSNVKFLKELISFVKDKWSELK
jgi:hypothetical protein